MSEIEKIQRGRFIDDLNFDDKGLIPAIIQDEADGAVLMLGYMNKESIVQTFEKGTVTFWSRSRQKYWTKGETSGNYLKVKEIYTDCDRDTILIKAEPAGPTCHTNKRSCFSWQAD
ncbi:phosphoribosyl-AMP cyclohydrolase [candidate division KSB1 bacterium]|nr:phosphoribosyl-AMP cyclohydrolase [candidate division KSB1 bacterium]